MRIWRWHSKLSLMVLEDRTYVVPHMNGQPTNVLEFITQGWKTIYRKDLASNGTEWFIHWSHYFCTTIWKMEIIIGLLYSSMMYWRQWSSNHCKCFTQQDCSCGPPAHTSNKLQLLKLTFCLSIKHKMRNFINVKTVEKLNCNIRHDHNLGNMLLPLI